MVDHRVGPRVEICGVALGADCSGCLVSASVCCQVVHIMPEFSGPDKVHISFAQWCEIVEQGRIDARG